MGRGAHNKGQGTKEISRQSMEKGGLIGRGRTAEVYAWGKDQILKLYQERTPGHVVVQEYNLTRAAYAAGLPVPAAEKLVEVDGQHGIIFERLVGPSMLKSLASQPWRVTAFARQLAELHARIHQCTLLPDHLPLQRQQIERGIQAAKDLSTPVKEATLSYLAQLPEGFSFCHGDFHPDNIILTSRGPFIIDWMTCTQGNPLADVCRTSLLFRTTKLPPGSPLQLRLMANALRIVIDTIYINRYLQLQPASRRQINAWQLPLLVARLREVENYPGEKQILLTRIRAFPQGSYALK